MATEIVVIQEEAGPFLGGPSFLHAFIYTWACAGMCFKLVVLQGVSKRWYLNQWEDVQAGTLKGNPKLSHDSHAQASCSFPTCLPGTLHCRVSTAGVFRRRLA